MAKRKIRKGDTVIAITGRDRGRTGEVLRVITDRDRVLVRGLGLVRRHRKADRSGAGGIESRESSLHISNVALVDPVDGGATRVRVQRDGDGSAHRISVRSGKRIES
ncbi:MAG: 50S ribosomal protein L24 [Alphaproteobacteria bacterium]|nr:50S ribosomal protein L24 [Alphaproteobacteria bacterium]MDA7982570.1 50S ribosomal protein L24 [Alphaproteobacteria bacterium]MDA7983964.1 50S ribosomal protein L24 [Alphaproteobacteria bacterium]MDA7986958.1 50S ribosomal protein L24 [Alphaproteobacteria bacterium]MDA7988111.1 50S ribosomal protein L24 [Alphaproteobacteria bacterium]